MVLGLPALRPLDPLSATLQQKRVELERAAQFVHTGMKYLNWSPDTASQYLGTVNAWHNRRALVPLAGGADLALPRAIAAGLAREFVPKPKPTRHGCPAHALAEGMDIVCGPRGQCDPISQAFRSLATACFCGLIRGGEAVTQQGKQWSSALYSTQRGQT